MSQTPSFLPPGSRDPLAALCKAGGDRLRLNILRVLSNDSFGVLELAQIFDVRQSGISHHLKVLAQAGLVDTRREGNAIFYRRALPRSQAQGGRLHAALLEEIDTRELEQDVQQRVLDIHDQRSIASRDYFAKAAEKLQAQQDLIAGLPQYRESLLSLIDTLRLPGTATILEVGPGDGGFLPDLSRRFSHVIALDNNPAMLDMARQTCEQAGLDNVELRLADALSEQPACADCVVLNMVLHHFATPERAMQQLSQLLFPGGSLLITDLCSHDQGWARQACGDLWLGFEQDELARWASAAGLSPGESLYIGLRNGFQIQVRHFAKPGKAAIATG